MNRILIFAAALLFAFSVSAQTNQKITLEDIFVKGTFKASSVNELRTMNDGECYSMLENYTRIVKYSYKTGKEVAVVFDITRLKDAPIKSFAKYEFSNDETKILLTTDIRPIYRHSYTASHYVWNSVTEELTPLSDKGAQQAPVFSNDGEKIAFVRANNIFIKNLKFGSESQITFDGAKNKVINGIPDWVYEEEFSFNSAMWWSPDNKFLAFIRFDESKVPDFSMPVYAGESPRNEQFSTYPGEETFKYPKAGERNSTVSVMVHEVRSRSNMEMEIGNDSNIYVPRLKWTPNSGNLLMMRLNRNQNNLDIMAANPFTGDSRILYTEKNKRYIDESFLDAFTILDDGRWILTSERNGWSHLFLHDSNGFQAAQLTSGKFDVTKFYGYDPVRKLYYYQAAAESPLRREVYYISEDGKKKGKLSSLQGTNDAAFSKNFNYYINFYSSAKTPNLVSVHENTKNTQLRIIQDNTVLNNTLKQLQLPAKDFFTFTTSQGVQLNGYMIRPDGFQEGKKYPVVMTQYSGPNSQSVADSWRGIGWEDYLAQQGFLVVCVDPRGTAARGEDFRKVTYLQLGRYESDDMVEAAKYLANQPFVDKNNIAIFGWSYGGFMVLLTMEKGGDLFKAGISVAPVTSYRFYDSVYTERYMRTPADNQQGYDENAPLNHAGNIKGRLLIIHGSADDNVHAQNTFEFTEKMVQAGVQFDMAIYTNRNHGIRGGNTTMHLYTKMTDFLKTQLQ